MPLGLEVHRLTANSQNLNNREKLITSFGKIFPHDRNNFTLKQTGGVKKENFISDMNTVQALSPHESQPQAVSKIVNKISRYLGFFISSSSYILV